MDKNKLMEHKAVTLAHKPLIVYIITILMISTSFIYFYVAYQDYQELLQISSSSPANQNTSDMLATRNEIAFFLVVAIAYIPIALWMLKVKHNSNIPYIVATLGSAALIIFYILTRTVDIPTIGLQTDVGVIDIASKIVQGGIVSISSFLIVSVIIRRNNRLENNDPTRGASKRKESMK